MRTFYLFEVKDNIIKNYRNNYEELYTMLENIHHLKTEDIVLGYSIFNSIVMPLKKDDYNEYVKQNNLDNENYICYNYTHTINDFYTLSDDSLYYYNRKKFLCSHCNNFASY